MTGNVNIWSKTPSANDTADGSINWQEGQLPPSVNNSARGMMAAIANWRDDMGGQLSLAGGTTAYTLTTNSVITALANGIMVSAKVNATNTGASTLAVDGLTAKSIRKQGDSAVAAGDLLIGAHVMLQYNSALNGAAGGWQLLGNSATVSGKLPMSHLAGLTIANGTDATNDINISAGECRDSTNSVDIVLPATLTKQLDAAWAVGTAAGGLDTGSIANTTYHIYLIKRLDTNVVDAIYSTSASAPTLPANYTHYRRIASIIRSGATILAFSQVGDVFYLATSVVDHTATTVGTSAVSLALTVPAGIQVQAIHTFSASNSSNTGTVYLSSLAQGDSAAGSGRMTLNVLALGSGYGSGTNVTMTNTSRQVRARADASAMAIGVTTQGWVDRRGKDL